MRQYTVQMLCNKVHKVVTDIIIIQLLIKIFYMRHHGT